MIEQDSSLVDIPMSQPKPAEHELLETRLSATSASDTTVKCLPGAQPDDVVAEFRKLASSHSYKRIVVHVGTNLVPKFSPAYTADKIVQCMETIRELSPTSKIAFSHVLPKESNRLLINFINHRVSLGGLIGPSRVRFGHVSHSEHFCNSFGHVDARLFKQDGIHLSALGVNQFNNSLNFLFLKIRLVA